MFGLPDRCSTNFAVESTENSELARFIEFKCTGDFHDNLTLDIVTCLRKLIVQVSVVLRKTVG